MTKINDSDSAAIVDAISAMQAQMRDSVVAAMKSSSENVLRASDGTASGDTAYGIDRVSEALLLELIARHLEEWLPLVLVAEGIPDVGWGPGFAVVPPSSSPENARFWVIVDPIDGTRGLMYGKRSAWILTGVAVSAEGRAPTLSDIDVAVQTEIPLPKQTLADTMWAVRNGGAYAVRTDLHAMTSSPLRLAPSAAASLDHGFGQVARVFPGCRDILAAIDDHINLAVAGPGSPGRGISFEDQYISTGGQLAELVYGHDRWIADLRPLLNRISAERGLPRPQCCHPYDICTALIAQESGVIVSGVNSPLNHPLGLDADVAWVGYANQTIRALVEPPLREAIALYLPGT